jgi:hypothetical protein
MSDRLEALFEQDEKALVVVYNAHPAARRVLVMRTAGSDWGLRDFFLDPDDEASLVGKCYEGENDEATEAFDTSRIHSPGVPTSGFAGLVKQAKGKGYGATMYMAAAVAIRIENRKRKGVHSGSGLDSGSRSADAARLWKGLVERGVATKEEIEGEEGEENYCESVEACFTPPSEIGNRKVKSTREVCTEVEVCEDLEVEGEAIEVDILYTEDVGDKPFILAVREDVFRGNFASPEGAEMAAVILPEVPDPRRIRMFEEFLRDAYGDEIADKFAERQDVAPYVNAATSAGPMRGTRSERKAPARSFRAAPPPLPKLSAESKRWAETMEGLD